MRNYPFRGKLSGLNAFSIRQESGINANFIIFFLTRRRKKIVKSIRQQLNNFHAVLCFGDSLQLNLACPNALGFMRETLFVGLYFLPLDIDEPMLFSL